MEFFDVIIVGGGPAGLECARVLASSTLRVLLLEKKDRFGDKPCAGGLTLKDMEVLPLPDHVIEHKIFKAVIHSRHRTASTVTPVPYLFTVNRKELGNHQRSLLEGSSVEVRTNSQVVEIDHEAITLKDGQRFGYSCLVGADGYASVVRRHLGLGVRRKLIGFQYTIPVRDPEPVLEVFLDARRFHVGYAWIFPHRESIAVGCCCDPDRVDHLRVKEGFQTWLHERGIAPGDARLESHPIASDYRGVRFGKLFLAGEAAGLASGFTGEGIYQSLVSGQEVARMILDPAHEPQMLGKVLEYNRMLKRLRNTFLCAGPLKAPLQDLTVALLNRTRIRLKVRDTFS
jgi:geranylgeranyl reductase family protein